MTKVFIDKADFLNSYSDKEQTEWCNFWYDKANVPSSKRILLVGDSVARQTRRSLSEILKCPVDLFATSAALRDAIYWEQWECFFKNQLYSYDSIIVWVGNHSRMNEAGTALFTDYDYIRFERDFEFLIKRCLDQSKKVIVLTTLHMVISRKYNHDIERIRRKLMIKPKEKLNDYENRVVEGKNTIMRRIAKNYSLKFHDIDKDLMESKFWHTDFIHYIPESNLFISEIIKQLLNNK